MVAPAATGPGILVVAVTVVSWVIACGPPWRVAGSFAMLGLAVFLPYFLLAPLIRAGSPGQAAGWTHALAAPWGVFLHGMAALLVSTATATTLSPSDLRSGMLALPVPGIVSAILLQIVNQTSDLAYETRRVAAAIAVRVASVANLDPAVVVPAQGLAAAGPCPGRPGGSGHGTAGLLRGRSQGPRPVLRDSG